MEFAGVHCSQQRKIIAWESDIENQYNTLYKNQYLYLPKVILKMHAVENFIENKSNHL